MALLRVDGKQFITTGATYTEVIKGTMFYLMRKFFSKKYIVCAFAVLMTGCASEKDTYKERSAAEIYNAAHDLLTRGDYTLAAKEFNEVDRQHPYSPWASKAQLMSAFSYFEAQKYDEAIDNLDIFMQLHPGHDDVAYAHYLVALCYYEQIPTVDRDQRYTRKAKESLQEIIQKYPKSKYARDAKIKLDLVVDHLAGHEMVIGRYYQHTWDNLAAMNRFKNVITRYEKTNHVPEALYRLVECYLGLGMLEEAHMTSAILGHNFRDSFWYKEAYELLKKYAKVKDYGGFGVLSEAKKASGEG